MSSARAMALIGHSAGNLWQLPLGNPLSSLKHLTFGQADEHRPSMFRDGKRLVYTDNRGGATQIMRRDLTTGKERPLPSAGATIAVRPARCG